MARSSRVEGSKGSKVQGSGKLDLVKVKLTLDRETVRLLRLEAFGRDCSLGQVVTELVRSSPRRFVLTDRSRGLAGSEVPAAHSAEGVQPAQGAVRALGLHSSEVA